MVVGVGGEHCAIPNFVYLRGYGFMGVYLVPIRGALFAFGIHVVVCCLRKVLLTPRPIAGADLASPAVAISDLRVSWKQNGGHWAPSYGHSHSLVTRPRRDSVPARYKCSAPDDRPASLPPEFCSRAPSAMAPLLLPYSQWKSWRERIRYVTPLSELGVRSPPSQTLYLVMACRDHGYRGGLGPHTPLPLPQRQPGPQDHGRRHILPQPHPLHIRLHVYCTTIHHVPRGTPVSPLRRGRRLISPQVWSLMLAHPAQSLFIGCFPMGAATLINAALVRRFPPLNYPQHALTSLTEYPQRLDIRRNRYK